MTTTLTTRPNAHPQLVTAEGLNVSILAGQVSPKSARMYARDTKSFTTWATEAGLDPLSPSTFARWRTALVNGTTYSPHTINRMLSAVKRVVREGAVQGHVSRDTAEAFDDVSGVKVRAMKDRRKKDARVRIAPETMRAICQAPDLDTLTGVRDRAFLLFLASSGVRVDDAVTLTVEQLERRDDGFGVMALGKNQTEAEFRPMTTEAWSAIQNWLKVRPVDSPVVFNANQGRGNRFTEKTMSAVSAWRMVKKYARKVDPALGNVKPHDFRRFVGTQVAKAHGVDMAQKVLGHKDARTTLNHYVLSEVRANVTEGLF